MSLKKYSLLTILIYAVCYLLPAFFPINLSLWITLFTYVLGAITLSFVYLRHGLSQFEKRPADWKQILTWGIGGIFLALILQAIASQIEVGLFGAPETSQNTAQIIGFVQSQPFFILAVTIGGPIMEEFVFRRAILLSLASKTPLWFAMCVSSLLFALIHFDGHLLLYTTLGLFFSFLYLKTGRIWTSIICHVGMNTLVVLLTIFLT
ncbi:lysostaphin resistance A-like protein [Enterococcus bulliens]